jgi:putative redox protein
LAGETEGLEKSLAGYKEKIPLETTGSIELDPEKDRVFTGRTSVGETIDFDPNKAWGCVPTDSLLVSLAGCLAIDVVTFLKKMRAEISSFRIEAKALRNPDPPQYFKSVENLIKIKGKNIDERKMKRAISLSKDKYCSVYHTLRKDLEYTITYEIESD